MKIIGAVLATVVFGMVAFQNCQPAPHPNDTNGSNVVVDANGTSNSIDLQGVKISDISFVFQENESVSRGSANYTVAVNKNLKVLLPSGQMTFTSDLDNTSQLYCLSETLTNELLNILKTAQVCKNSSAVREGQVCTQVVQLPYAIVATEKATYELGSASDGCGSNAVDLCGQQATLLQGFYASLKANYKSFSCSQ